MMVKIMLTNTPMFANREVPTVEIIDFQTDMFETVVRHIKANSQSGYNTVLRTKLAKIAQKAFAQGRIPLDGETIWQFVELAAIYVCMSDDAITGLFDPKHTERKLTIIYYKKEFGIAVHCN